MNNNYFFNPNLMRSVPFTNVIGTGARMVPRGTGILSGLFGGARGASSLGASKITFSSILNGTSKTLGVINQAIPVFYQVKPIWNNARTMFKVAKEINSSNTSNNIKQKNETVQNISKTKKENRNGPTFFI